MERLVMRESSRPLPYVEREFPKGTKVLAPMRKVPQAWSPGVVDSVQREGVCVAMLHPSRANCIYTVFAPEDLIHVR